MLNLKTLNIYSASLAMLLAGMFAGCSQTYMQSRHVSTNIRNSLDQAGFKNVSVSQDRVKGVVTLGGHVAAFGDKTQAESIAASLAAGEVVSDQIAVLPVGAESEASAMNSDLDSGIEHNLDAALIQNKLHERVKYGVKNHVVTLTGEVDSQSRRAQAESVASSVPNVWQVVNELQIRNQKATSSN
jgi:osmotically-inducible protein OsmY